MKYDVIIIGAGTAGMTAAVYVQRAGRHALILEGKGYGGQITNAGEVENYPGIPRISGIDFGKSLYDQMTAMGAEFRVERVTSVTKTGAVFSVTTGAGKYEASTVILATGAKNRTLGIDGETKLTGSGVSYCATCDGNFFRGRDVAVVGGGNTALDDAEILSGIAGKVYLVHRRDSFRGAAATVQRLAAHENVEFVLESVPVSVNGGFAVESLTVKNVRTGEDRVLEVAGVFVAIGQEPDNQAFSNVAELDRAGYIVAGEDCMTRTAGLFAAGDCRTKSLRQLTTAAADGSVAGVAAVAYLNAL